MIIDNKEHIYIVTTSSTTGTARVSESTATSTVLFMGVGKLIEIVTLNKFKQQKELYNSKDCYNVEVFEEYNPQSFKLYKDLYQPQLALEPRSNRVRCIETGEVFNSMYQASKELGISFALISNHINGKKGYGSAKGLHFERV